MKLLSCLLISISFIACGGDSNVENKSEKYSYNFTTNGCSTGAQSFSSLGAYCNALTDDRLNNFCASESRCRTFKQNCREEDVGVTCILPIEP